jgi:RHS repeat-associated protein
MNVGGTIQARYQYDAFGNTRAQAGTTFNRFTFTGHEKDTETGLYYFKARFYDSDTGRFLSQDPYLGEVNTPPSLHRYLYAYSNPTVYVDLTGYASEELYARPGESLSPDVQQSREAERERKLATNKGNVDATTSAKKFSVPYEVWLYVYAMPQEAEESLRRRAATARSVDRSDRALQIQEKKNLDSVDDYVEVTPGQRQLVIVHEAGNQAFGTLEKGFDIGSGIVNPAKGASDFYEAAKSLSPEQLQQAWKWIKDNPKKTAVAAIVVGLCKVKCPEIGGATRIGGRQSNDIVSSELKVASSETRETQRLALPPAKSADEIRNSPGLVSGGSKSKSAAERFFIGTDRNVARIPKEVSEKLVGRKFNTFDDLREEVWRTVAGTPQLARQFSARDIARMRNGWAPAVDNSQRVGKLSSYQIHHRTPISQGGPVYDLDNLLIVTPRYHQEILDRAYHAGK